MSTLVIHGLYILASFLVVFGLRGLTHPTTARRGTGLAALGMLIAIAGTLLHQEILTFKWIALGIVSGTIIGIPMGLWIPMTKMPERIALSHSFGGLAVSLIGVVEYARHGGHLNTLQMGATGFEVLFGAVTFTGSLMAFGKLQGLIRDKPITYPLQNASNLSLLAAAFGMVFYLVYDPTAAQIFYGLTALAFLLGILLVAPIGGADMPVVICLLNSYAGLAAAASGFALNNNVLIICGALDGGSGFILALIMSKAMNRSFTNVIFGAFGSDTAAKGPAKEGAIKEASTEDVGEFLKAANSVIIVPGYGMAASQAQHAVKGLADILAERGTTVRYAIHPVAGRMPGHMNVLLAEANVPYEQLLDLEEINPHFPEADVALVIGANDITNPAARTDKSSPIYGMPILDVDKARTIVVLKRSMKPGFAGIDNDLYIDPKTLMYFGDAKGSILALSAELK